MPLPLRAALRGPSTLALPGGSWWFWLALVAPVPWLVARVVPRTRARGATPSAVAAPGTTRARLEQGVRARTGLDIAAFTAPGSLAAALRLEGVTAETAAEAEALRDACDAQGFGGARASAADAALPARATALLNRLRTEARRRLVPVLLLLSSAVASGCARPAMGSEEAQQAFAETRTAYVGRDYTRARDAALRAARAAPRDAAAWANLGAAAWQASDTAAAVLGWQRALRLDPQDAATRRVLRRVRAPQHRGAARVWPVPPLPVAVAALVLWCVGWGLLAVAARRRVRAPRVALALLAVATVSGVGAWWLDTTLAARALVVIAEPTPIRALPALGADPGAMPMTGEIARVLERRGVWLHLELDGGRSGWYPTERTWSLARD